MISVRIHRDEDDEHGILVQLITIPRLGETISIPDDDGVERDRKVTGVNHWVKPIEGQLQQIEIVVFCAPTVTLS